MLKNRLRKWSKSAAFALAGVASLAANAATPTQINTAIDSGLAYLAANQQPGGYWNYGGYEPAATGAAVFAMMSQKNQWGANAVAYQAAVDKGMAYLLSNGSSLTIATVSTRNDGVNICPGGGSCTGVYWVGAGESSYTTGLIASAIGLYAQGNAGAVATTSGPLANQTWTQIAQGIANTWAASQSTANQNVQYGSWRQGGWRYGLNDGYDSDSSTTQWGVLSLIYSQSLGAVTPGITKSDLQLWLNNAQVAGQGGAACYQPNYLICDQADTGGLLLGLAFEGKTASDPAVQSAIAYLNTNWKQFFDGSWNGNFNDPYAMWAEYKGLETLIGLNDTTQITNLLDSACGGPTNAPATCNWWQDYNEWLVNDQNGNGSWDGAGYWTGALATAFFLPILGGTAIPNPTVPEPTTLALAGLALAGLAASRRRKAA